MEFSKIKKIIIAPQIVVYRNIIKDPSGMIDCFINDHSESIFTPMREWYDSGYRKDCLFKKDNIINIDDSDNLKLEKKYLREISNATDFIKNDYLEMFENEKGIWASFIDNWDVLKKEKQYYEIDFFEYSIDKKIHGEIQKTGREVEHSYLMMDYHVDEFPVNGENKSTRSVVTINYYLNDDYEGGEICAYDSISNKNYIYKPQAGDAVVMPSTAPFYHGVMSYKNANRYFARTFIRYDVDKSKEWKDEYRLVLDHDKINSSRTEEEYVKNDLQTIKISADAIVIDPNSY